MSPGALDAALFACMTAGIVDVTVLNVVVVPELASATQAEPTASARPSRAPNSARLGVAPAPELMSLPDEACLDGRPALLASGPPRALAVTLEFELESRHLHSPERYRLKQSLPALRAAAQITVVGHADASGPLEYNERLSQDRAAAALRLLLEHGIPAERVVTEAHGQREPLAQGNSRRVEIYIGGRP